MFVAQLGQHVEEFQPLAGLKRFKRRQDQRMPLPRAEVDYGRNLLAEVYRYAHTCSGLAEHESFDVIHAHDWMTYPAGLAIAAQSGKPLVAHL